MVCLEATCWCQWHSIPVENVVVIGKAALHIIRTQCLCVVGWGYFVQVGEFTGTRLPKQLNICLSICASFHRRWANDMGIYKSVSIILWGTSSIPRILLGVRVVSKLPRLRGSSILTSCRKSTARLSPALICTYFSSFWCWRMLTWNGNLKLIFLFTSYGCFSHRNRPMVAQKSFTSNFSWFSSLKNEKKWAGKLCFHWICAIYLTVWSTSDFSLLVNNINVPWKQNFNSSLLNEEFEWRMQKRLFINFCCVTVSHEGFCVGNNPLDG